MLIRVEIGIDAPGIDALLRRTFGRDAEAQLVHDLREDGLITLGVVATDDEGQVIGYVAFSPVAVEGEELQWVGLAPLAVDERYRGQNVTLKRFGSPRDSSVLYLELPIYAPPFDQDMAAFADSLEARGQEFFHVITENNENLEYLKKCGITSVTIRFATSWDNRLEGPERYREFSWEL